MSKLASMPYSTELQSIETPKETQFQLGTTPNSEPKLFLSGYPRLRTIIGYIANIVFFLLTCAWIALFVFLIHYEIGNARAHRPRPTINTVLLTVRIVMYVVFIIPAIVLMIIMIIYAARDVLATIRDRQFDQTAMVPLTLSPTPKVTPGGESNV